ncbi:MAG: DUF177 domain-containing protein [bacterium]
MEQLEQFPSLFRIKVRGLGSGKHRINLHAPVAELDLPMYHGEIGVSGEALIAENVHLHLQIECEGDFICDRCGIEFTRVMRSEIDLFYVPPELAKDAEEDDNIHTYDPQQSSEIDCTADIRDALLLAIPMKNLHSKDCKGIVLLDEPREIDERLSGLGNLFDKLRQEELNSDEKKGV